MWKKQSHHDVEKAKPSTEMGAFIKYCIFWLCKLTVVRIFVLFLPPTFSAKGSCSIQCMMVTWKEQEAVSDEPLAGCASILFSQSGCFLQRVVSENHADECARG